MNKEAAKSINDLMMEITFKLESSGSMVKSNCTEEEFRRYSEAVANILGEMLTEIMQPIYREHPELAPEGLKY